MHAAEVSMPRPVHRAKSDCDVVIVAAIGASGAPTLDTTNSTAGTSITRSDTGDYSLTFPGMLKGAPRSVCVVGSTIATVQVLTFSATAGTATITCYSDAITTAADPGNGDTLIFEAFGARFDGS